MKKYFEYLVFWMPLKADFEVGKETYSSQEKRGSNYVLEYNKTDNCFNLFCKQKGILKRNVKTLDASFTISSPYKCFLILKFEKKELELNDNLVCSPINRTF